MHSQIGPEPRDNSHQENRNNDYVSLEQQYKSESFGPGNDYNVQTLGREIRNILPDNLNGTLEEDSFENPGSQKFERFRLKASYMEATTMTRDTKSVGNQPMGQQHTGANQNFVRRETDLWGDIGQNQVNFSDADSMPRDSTKDLPAYESVPRGPAQNIPVEQIQYQQEPFATNETIMQSERFRVSIAPNPEPPSTHPNTYEQRPTYELHNNYEVDQSERFGQYQSKPV